VLLVTHGQMYVAPRDHESFAPVLVETGDLVVMARSFPYRLLYPLDAPQELETTLVHVKDSSKAAGDEVEFLGMICFLDRAHRNLLTDFLPPLIHLKKATPGLTRWIKRPVSLFLAEYQAQSPGRSSILSRLAEIICMQALRIWIEQMPADMKGWIQGLKDEQISLALQAIHRDPGERWTVALLARQAGMSRSVFAARFKALVGESPMAYLSRWRMHRAIGLLEDGTGNLKSVVEASGYKSPTTFRDAFRRHFGMLPSDYRRQ
jgi:AraC-like DNA-binding protein